MARNEVLSLELASKYPHHFQGNMLAALAAFRQLVEGVSQIHDAGLAHRDIKPANVFMSSDNRLVLGDLGMVFFADDQRTRVMETYKNVGSRDWMPGWAMGIRVEDVKPSFDVFSLGKLFWSMLSGRPKLQPWYHHRDEFELEKMLWAGSI